MGNFKQSVRWDCYLSCLGEKSSLLKLLMSSTAVAKGGVVGRDGLTPLSYGLHTPTMLLPSPPHPTSQNKSHPPDTTCRGSLGQTQGKEAKINRPDSKKQETPAPSRRQGCEGET